MSSQSVTTLRHVVMRDCEEVPISTRSLCSRKRKLETCICGQIPACLYIEILCFLHFCGNCPGSQNYRHVVRKASGALNHVGKWQGQACRAAWQGVIRHVTLIGCDPAHKLVCSL